MLLYKLTTYILMWQMKKVWKNVLKIDSGSSFSILDGYKLWHMALMFFGKKKLKSIFK